MLCQIECYYPKLYFQIHFILQIREASGVLCTIVFYSNQNTQSYQQHPRNHYDSEASLNVILDHICLIIYVFDNCTFKKSTGSRV